jgi:hypothetical protein
MRRSLFFYKQLVKPDDLNNIETSMIEQIKYRTQGIAGTSVGVFGSVVDRFDRSKNFFITKDSPTQITVAPGTALDINGELIVIPAAKVMQYAVSDSHYKWSSGYTGQVNYVKLRYQEVSGSLRTTAAGVSSYTKFVGDYYVTIDGVVNTSGEVLLGTYTSDTSGGISGAITDSRSYVSVITTASASVLDPTFNLSPLVHKNLEDHVRASGSVTPSNTNPHGLSAVDIGAVPITATNIVLQPKFNNTLNAHEVYQNSSGSTMFLSCTVQMNDAYTDTVHVAMFALMVAATGSIGPGLPGQSGYLTPPYYTLCARYFRKSSTAAGTDGTTYSLVAPLRGFIPANWFYQVTLPLNESTILTVVSGSIINSLRYW